MGPLIMMLQPDCTKKKNIYVEHPLIFVELSLPSIRAEFREKVEAWAWTYDFRYRNVGGSTTWALGTIVSWHTLS